MQTSVSYLSCMIGYFLNYCYFAINRSFERHLCFEKNVHNIQTPTISELQRQLRCVATKNEFT